MCPFLSSFSTHFHTCGHLFLPNALLPRPVLPHEFAPTWFCPYLPFLGHLGRPSTLRLQLSPAPVQVPSHQPQGHKEMSDGALYSLRPRPSGCYDNTLPGFNQKMNTLGKSQSLMLTWVSRNRASLMRQPVQSHFHVVQT